MDAERVIITPASPETILKWAPEAEVEKPETLNYRTGKAEPNGLFSERIFGPIKDFQCACGETRKIGVMKGKRCDICGVEVISSKVRRRRMGYVTLPAPVAHIWYFRGTPSSLSIILDIPSKEIERIIYYYRFIVTHLNPLLHSQYLTKVTEQKAMEKIPGIDPEIYEESDVKPLLLRLQQFSGRLVDAVFSEVAYILAHAKEKSYTRTVQPLDYLSSFISKKELYAPVMDEQTGEILAEKGEKISLRLLEIFLKAAVDCAQLQVIMDRKIPLAPHPLHKSLAKALSEEELEEDVKDPTTGEQTLSRGTGMDVALWKILSTFGNSLPIVIANREQKKLFQRTREKRVREIQEIVEGIEALYQLRAYSFVRDSDETLANFLVSGEQWKQLSAIAAVIRKRMEGESPEDLFRISTGAEALLTLLKTMKLPEVIQQLKEKLADYEKGKRRAPKDAKWNRITRRLQLLERLNRPEFKPEWLILSVIPIVPPDLRPMVQLEGGKHASSDLNELYRMVITRKNRLLKLMKSHSPEVLIRNEKRILQEAVDALLDNSKKLRPYVDSSGRPWKSIADTLKGKQGRFRQNLLGKRVDYSGRAVIVVGPHLKLWQCGLPRAIALELLKPIVMYYLSGKDAEHKFGSNIREIRKKIERVASLPPQDAELIWEALEKAIKGRVVLLNRAPTLHRMGIQAFEPVLIDEHVIQINPLVCTAYNADFDGDQMAVHLPLSIKSTVESRFLMLSTNNILLPADGTPIVNPTQDMVLGLHYITLEPTTPPPSKEKEQKLPTFTSLNEVEKLYEERGLKVHDWIRLRIPTSWWKGEQLKHHKPYTLITTTVGKALFNALLPEEMRFETSSVNKKVIKDLVQKCFRTLGLERAVHFLDVLKEKGFHYATMSGISLSVTDCFIPPEKYQIVKDAEKKVEALQEKYQEASQRPLPVRADDMPKSIQMEKQVIGIWEKTMRRIWQEVEGWEDKKNPLLMIVQSGSRGAMDQVIQICGMRGLMRDPAGKIIPLPIRTNFREGLSVHEYFISTHGGRKGLTDTALRTSKSGYLTRRLVDLAQEVVINEDDCETSQGIRQKAFKQKGEEIISLPERILGRYVVKEVFDPQTGEIIVQDDEMIEEPQVEKIQQCNIPSVLVRSPISCDSPVGLCRKCYGRNFATGYLVDLGEAVGIIAAQAIGEPGTQLTLRTFHSGGIAGEQVQDITQGLPLAEVFFEVYLSHFVPRREGALLAKHKGRVVEISESREKEKETRVVIETDEGKEETYLIPAPRRPTIQEGDEIMPGQPMTDGYQNPLDLLKLMGVQEAAQYIINMIQSVYRSQGVYLNDKHFEVILSQMLKFVEIVHRGDSHFQENTLVSKMDFLKVAEKLKQEGKKTPVVAPALVGVKRAAILSPSFLSAASFQETARVLTQAALEGKVDYLHGLKENIVIGKEIPAGTGFPLFRSIKYKIVPDTPPPPEQNST